MKVFFRQTLAMILLAAGVFIVLQTTLQSSIVVGASMEPNFREGQRLIINKVVYRFGEPGRGDVIVFHPPSNDRADYIKRIIGLPGDTIEIKDKVVYVNGAALGEPYVENPPGYSYKEYEVPPDEYFVLGDNRNHSNDSHNGWAVPRENIIGKVWISIWPPSEWGLVPNHFSSN